MTYAQNHSYDLFVSYAHVDNEPMYPADRGWVTVLIDNLNCFLAKQLGRREVLSHWFDQHSLHGNSGIRDRVVEQARSSALFLAILSPGYIASEFCMREVKAFVQAHGKGVDGRLFVVEHMPILQSANVPDELADLLKYRFWRMDENNRPRTFALPKPLPDEREYFQKIDDLAQDMSAKLTAETVSGPSGPSVFLAEVTDDLEQRRDNLKRYLAQAGINVLPSRTYRLDREDFERSCATDLAKCVAFVQILGPFAGKRPPDVPDGFGWLQLELAKRQRELPILQWRDPKLDPASVEIPLHRALLEGEYVQAAPFEDFKRSIVSTVKRKTAPPPANPATKGGASLVFINADSADASNAEMIKNALDGRFGLLTPVTLGQGSAKAATVDKDAQYNMIHFDVLVLIYGGAPPDWVTGQQRLYLKLEPRRSKGKKNKTLILLAEAPPEPKAPLPIRLPGMITVRIDKVVDALNAAFPP